ncbi:AAA family ATPase [Runella sp.]|uniref:AAA family ATPase n=1 Tax=Runella sp. TaxID=1960881 RepID=UPI003016C104
MSLLAPQDFPYITQIYVSDCYTYQGFDIVLNNDKPFSHLVLTGKNGSGKSTILRSLDSSLTVLNNRESIGLENHIKYLNELIRGNINHPNQTLWREELKKLQNVTANFGNYKYYHQSLYSFLKANRDSNLEPVSTVKREDEFIDNLNKQKSSEFFIKQFKQYLVNKKVTQAFDILDNNQAKIADTERFFSLMTQSLKNILEDQKLELIFVKDNFEFFIQLRNGQKITFENLSDGFSALISILMDLFMRVDIIRKEVKDFSYNPCGIVLIDEPETHLHLKLQYEVMPLLTSLFPNVQFIVATHSPAVISSIKKATVFDLTSKSTETESIVGSSFSELMVSHFGLDNEYSNIADDIFAQINHIVKTETNPQIRRKRLQTILTENERYLSPAMQLELESMILELQ